MAIDLFEAAKDREKALKPLYTRMDNDMKLYYLEQFVLQHNGKNIPNSDSVTLNDPRTYADRVISVLGSAKRRFDVAGEVQVQRSVEKFLNTLFPLNDSVLAAQMMEELEFNLDFFSALRGWIAVRALILEGGGVKSPEIVPLDPRWCSWQAGRDGLAWASYRVAMSPGDIETTYGKEQPSGGKDKIVRSVWSTEQYGVCIEGEESSPLVPLTAHNLGHCPVIIAPAPTHPSLIIDAKKGIAYRGESIYAANRTLYGKLNEVVSVWATLNKMSFLAPIGFVTPNPEREINEMPGGIGVVVQLLEGESFVAIPTKEVAVSQQNLFGGLMAAMQRGSLPNVDYGELGFELSAVAISKLTESRNVVFQPRLRVKSTVMSRAGSLCIKQWRDGGYKTDLGENAMPLIFDDKFEDKPFQIQVNYHSVSPEQNVANFTIAQAAKVVGLSDKTIYRDVLQLEDPEGEIVAREAENAEKEVPDLRLYRYAVSLLKQYEETKDETLQVSAQIIAKQLNMTITASGVGAPGEGTEPPPNAASQPKPGLRMPAMPAVAAQHVEKEEAKRKGIETLEEGKKSQRVGA